MSNEITTTDPTNREMRWSAPSLEPRLSALLDRRESYLEMPVIGPKSAGQLQAFVDAPQPGLPRRDQVDKLVGLLRMALPSRGMSDAEADGLLEQCWIGLRDVAIEALHHAYAVILKEDRWFPTVARIREASAGSTPSAYRARRLIAKTLLMKHRTEWREPVPEDEKADPAEVAKVLAGFASMGGPIARAVEASERPKRRYCSVCLFASDNPLTVDCLTNRGAGCGLSPDYAVPVEEAAE